MTLPKDPRQEIDYSSASLEVGGRERALIGPEIEAFARQLPGAAGTEYAALAAAVASGTVTGTALERLETFLDLGLQTGRFRDRLGGVSADALQRLFEKTPLGSLLTASAAEVTRALAALRGQSLQDLNLTLVGPGRYRLLLETDRCRINIGLGPGGAAVENLEITM